MGLFFNRKTSFDGEKHSSSNYKKRIPDAEIDKYDIRDISKELDFDRFGARQKFEKLIMRKQHGGLKRSEVVDALQEMVVSRKTTEDDAVAAGKKLGLTDADLRKIKDISEVRNREARHSHEEREQENNDATDGNQIRNQDSIRHEKEDDGEKPKSVWNFINNSKLK